MQDTQIPTTTPVKVAPDTYLIPNLAPAEPGTFVPVNSLVILGEEPIVVDTGAPVHREHWLEMVYGLVDPEDIRWVFLSPRGRRPHRLRSTRCSRRPRRRRSS